VKKDPRDAPQLPIEREVSRSPSLTVKKTKRWCRGKVGVEHKPVVSNYAALGKLAWLPGAERWLVLYCSACGKELDSYTPPHEDRPTFISKRRPPPWASKHLASKSEPTA
jgi:hypothetical protein